MAGRRYCDVRMCRSGRWICMAGGRIWLNGAKSLEGSQSFGLRAIGAVRPNNRVRVYPGAELALRFLRQSNPDRCKFAHVDAWRLTFNQVSHDGSRGRRQLQPRSEMARRDPNV